MNRSVNGCVDASFITNIAASDATHLRWVHSACTDCTMLTCDWQALGHVMYKYVLSEFKCVPMSRTCEVSAQQTMPAVL